MPDITTKTIWRPYCWMHSGHFNNSKTDVSDVLPIANSKEEALEYVRAIPQKWPEFQHRRVEYTEEKIPK